jgi:GAF domain-containing protein
MSRFDTRASLTAPIQTNGRFVGGVAVLSATPRMWLPDETMLVEAIGKQIGEVVERLQLFQATQRRTAELEAFYDLSRELRKAHSVEQMYPMVVGHALGLLAADHGALVLVGPDRETLIHAHTMGIEAQEPGSVFPAEGTRSGMVLKTGVTFVTEDFSAADPPLFARRDVYRPFGPLVIVPVRSEEENIGTLRLGRRKSPGARPFSDAEVRLLEGIAEVAGTAIRRARLHHNLEQSYIEMVLALARAADARDSYTGDHSERIAIRAVALARALGCSQTEVQNIHWGALLHDIGKLGVPDSILRKPGPLSDAEWRSSDPSTGCATWRCSFATIRSAGTAPAIPTDSVAKAFRWAPAFWPRSTRTARSPTTARTTGGGPRTLRWRSCGGAPAPSSTRAWSRCSAGSSWAGTMTRTCLSDRRSRAGSRPSGTPPWRSRVPYRTRSRLDGRCPP